MAQLWIPASSLSTFICPELYINPILPHNMHRYKPCTSNPSPEELQKLREVFNPGHLHEGVIALTIQTWNEILSNRSQKLLDSHFIGNRRTKTTIDAHPCKHSHLWDILSQISCTTLLRFMERYISLGLSFVLPSQLLWDIPGKHTMLPACRTNLHLSLFK